MVSAAVQLFVSVAAACACVFGVVRLLLGQLSDVHVVEGR